MAEREDAIKLANIILNQPSRDPDDDLSVLSRQLLRTHEALRKASHGDSCLCPDCFKPDPVHASDCALHNGPALPVGPCDCGIEKS